MSSTEEDRLTVRASNFVGLGKSRHIADCRPLHYIDARTHRLRQVRVRTTSWQDEVLILGDQALLALAFGNR